VLSIDRIFARKLESSPNPRSSHAQEFTAARANSSPGEARGAREEASYGPSQDGGSLEEPHTVGRVCEKEATAIHSPRHPQPHEG
jgi:hypothetical protein